MSKPETLADVVRELLAYEAPAFEQDTPMDLADLCSEIGRMRVRLKQALGLELRGAELDYGPEELDPFRRARHAGFDVEPNGFGAGFYARDPEGEPLSDDVFETERAAWEACEAARTAQEA